MLNNDSLNGCEGNPSFIVQDASGNTQTGLATDDQEISVDSFPATVCLSKDDNSCISNSAKVTSSGQTVTVQSCSTLETMGQ